MASETFLRAALLLTLAGCAGAPRFPLKPPVTHDNDERPMASPPGSYESPFMWDGANQLVFRPIARFWAVDPAGIAANVNAVDEVPFELVPEPSRRHADDSRGDRQRALRHACPRS